MQNTIPFLKDHATTIFLGLFFLSEALALIPQVKSNSIFQLIFGFLKTKAKPELEPASKVDIPIEKPKH